MKKASVILSRSAVLFCLAWLTGCVTQIEEPEPLARTRLVVTRAGDTATLQWQSQSDMRYTLYHAANRKPGTKWETLPGAVQVQGTGGLMKYEDKPPLGSDRLYRIQATPLAKAPGKT